MSTSHFLSLPRELRDMIYLSLLTSTRPLPTLRDTEVTTGWNRPWEPKSGLGDHGCAFSAKRAPGTVANVLVTSRQVHEEMQGAIARARRKGLVAARMDCVVRGEMHYFTWLSIPLVRTGGCEGQNRSQAVGKKGVGVLPQWAKRYLAPQNHECASATTTKIEKLWIDIRLFGDAGEKRGSVVESPRDRTSWAICAALKHVFEHDPEIIPTRDCRNDIEIGEVVLNVVPQSPPSSASLSTPSSTTTAEQDAKDNPQLVAKELVDVWYKIWSGDEFKARYYRNLLERIQKVRVCVEGTTYRVRELRVELERGQAERRRIEMRMR